MRDKNDEAEIILFKHSQCGYTPKYKKFDCLRLRGMKIFIFYTNYLSGEAVQVLKKKHRNKDF